MEMGPENDSCTSSGAMWRNISIGPAEEWRKTSKWVDGSLTELCFVFVSNC